MQHESYYYNVLLYHQRNSWQAKQAESNLNGVLDYMNHSSNKTEPGFRFSHDVKAFASETSDPEIVRRAISGPNPPALVICDHLIDDDEKLNIVRLCNAKKVKTAELLPTGDEPTRLLDDDNKYYEMTIRNRSSTKLFDAEFPEAAILDENLNSEARHHLLQPLFALNIMMHHYEIQKEKGNASQGL